MSVIAWFRQLTSATRNRKIAGPLKVERMRWIDRLSRRKKGTLLSIVTVLGILLFYPGPWSAGSVLVVVAALVVFLVLVVWQLRKGMRHLQRQRFRIKTVPTSLRGA